ncbi:MAG: helicase C-terminal domain-containing protein [Candidatus Ranarchaeia archaeon]
MNLGGEKSLKKNISRNKEEDAFTLFPYKPYIQQKEFIRDCSKVFEEGRIGFLEAPTGFGKTAALLASSLSHRNQIFYASRTHTQMEQVAHELKEIQKKDKTISAVIIGSRNKLCLYPKIRHAKNYDKACEDCISKIVTKSGQPSYNVVSEDDKVNEGNILSRAAFCKFGDKKIKILQTLPKDVPKIITIKELMKYGKENQVCPYYLAQKLSEKRKVVIGSYNYIFLGFPITEKNLILDEAHNIEEICQKYNTFMINEIMIINSLKNLKTINKMVFQELREFLLLILDFLKKSKFEKEQNYPRKTLLLEMRKFKIDTQVFSRIENFLKLTERLQKELIRKNKKMIIRDKLPSYRVLNFMKSFLESESDTYIGIWKNQNYGKELHWFCLDPKIGFSKIQNQQPNSIVLTSGTLSPLEGQIHRLGLKDVFNRSYSTIISRENIFLIIIGNDSKDTPLSTQFRVRNQKNVVNGYGDTIKKLLEKIPNGSLIFYPSYGYLNNVRKIWDESGIRLNEEGKEFTESNESTSEETLRNYRKEAKSKQTVLHAVARGKLSEGQNFPDEEGRAVLIVGIPYPDFSDPKIQAQMNYYDKIKSGYGHMWYMDSALRIVNQALGRVWRHKNDYAISVLIDHRYLQSNIINRISPWIRENIFIVESKTQMNELNRMIDTFFDVTPK